MFVCKVTKYPSLGILQKIGMCLTLFACLTIFVYIAGQLLIFIELRQKASFKPKEEMRCFFLIAKRF